MTPKLASVQLCRDPGGPYEGPGWLYGRPAEPIIIATIIITTIAP